MRRGEVYFVDFGKDKTTHKQCGIRPAVIVSNNRGNGHGPTVTVVPLNMEIKSDFGLSPLQKRRCFIDEYPSVLQRSLYL